MTTDRNNGVRAKVKRAIERTMKLVLQLEDEKSKTALLNVLMNARELVNGEGRGKRKSLSKAEV